MSDRIPGCEDYPVLFRAKAPPPAFPHEDSPDLEVAVVALNTHGGVMILGRYSGDWRENQGWVPNAGERAVVRLLMERIADLEGRCDFLSSDGFFQKGGEKH